MVTDPQFPLSSCLQPVFRYLAFPFLPLSQSLADLQLCVCPWQTCRRQRRAHYLSRAGCKRRGQSSQLHHLDHSLGPRGCVIVDTTHTPLAGSRPHGDVGPLCQVYLKSIFFHCLLAVRLSCFIQNSTIIQHGSSHDRLPPRASSLQVHDHTATLVRSARVICNLLQVLLAVR